MVSDLKLDGDDVSFNVTVDVQGQPLPLVFTGKLSGTTLAGIYSVEALGEVADVTAVKVNTTRVVFVTEVGEFEVEVQTDAAPITSANFLRYVDEGFFNGGQFHRAVRLDNQSRSDVLIEVIQARVKRDDTRAVYPAIELERTNMTGLKHVDGAISMARGGPDSATSSFFICIGAQPSLDFGGNRNDDG